MLQGVRPNARILHKHVDDLLDVTRLEADMLELKRRRVDLAELLRRSAGLFERAADRAIDFGSSMAERTTEPGPSRAATTFPVSPSWNYSPFADQGAGVVGVAATDAAVAQPEDEGGPLGRSRAKSKFLAVMPHELRTPLNAIIGYTELMAHGITGPLTDQQRKHLERIKANTSHLLGMIEDVLEFASGEADDRTPAVAAMDLDALIRELEAIVGGQALEKGLQLEIGGSEPAEILNTDRRRLRKILLNLLENAVKYTDEGAVQLTVRFETAHAVCRVEDTGPGIQPEHHERIFDEFWQVDQPSTMIVPSGGAGS